MLLANKSLKNELPIACDLTAIPAEQLEQHRTIAKQVFLAVGATRELPDGYAFRLPETSEMLLKAAEFVSKERLCCSFFNFTLEIEPEGGPLWLKLTGGEGVKQFIQAEVLPWGLSLKGDTAFQMAKQINKNTEPAIHAPVIACDLNAIPADRRERWLDVGKQVYAAVQEVHELPDGYACRLPGDPAMLLTAAEYVSLDRLCCAFVRWSLVIEPRVDSLWLHLTGAEGTKEAVRNIFETTPLLDENVAKAAGFNLSSRAPWVHPSNPALIID